MKGAVRRRIEVKGRAAPQTATGGVGESTVDGPPSERLGEQYSLAKILGVWAAAALPMAALAWVVAPLVAGRLPGPLALPRALLGLLTALNDSAYRVSQYSV